MTQWQAPGLAAVIVRDDRVLFMKGFGLRELGKPEPVTPSTVFPLASCSKSFTALALAMLVDDGKIAWDDPVRRHLPYFHLADPSADAAVTLRDLLCHRTGVAGHDALWYRAPWTLEERIRKAGRLELAQPFRGGFQYQTIFFGAAGLAASRAAGMPWEELVRRRILEPLDMTSAAPTFAGAAQRELASPHRRDDGGSVRICERYPLEQPDPAGSIHACVRDLERYLRFQLGDGSWQGRRLVSSKSLRETHMPQALLRLEGYTRVMNPETRFLTYGLGWIVQDYRGREILMHGGAIDGFRAHLTLVPEERLGIALVNNLDGCFLNLALSNQILDLYFGAPVRDWSAYYLGIEAEERRLQKERARQLRADKGAAPPLSLADYAGRYRDVAYGDCTIALEAGRLHWRWGSFDFPMEPLDGHTFLVNQRPMVDAPVRFTVAGGKVEAVRVLQRDFRRVDHALSPGP